MKKISCYGHGRKLKNEKDFYILTIILNTKSQTFLGMSDDEVLISDLIETLANTNDYGDLKHMVEHSVAPIEEPSFAQHRRSQISAAYDVAKENVGAWAPVVTERQKQRAVTFGNEDEINFVDFTPVKTEFGNELETILKEEKLTRDTQEALEDDSFNSLSEEQIREKMEHLARLKSIQFYNEKKAKRWKKIKSKAFRKIHKNEHSDLTYEELAEIDPNLVKARMSQQDKKRALERVTLRHKNTSAWVRRILLRGLDTASDENKKNFEEQLRLGQELTQKIQDPIQEEDEESIRQRIDDSIRNDEQLKQLFNMKFMKDAEIRKDKEIQKIGNENMEQESTGIVTVKSHTNLSLKISVPNDVTEQKAHSNVDIEYNEVKKQSTTQSNPFINASKPQPKKKRSCFVNAASMSQPTETELKKISQSYFSKNDDQNQLMADAFSYTEEFQKEKERQALKDAEKDLAELDELHLPGWGSWTGPSGEQSKGAKLREDKIIRARNDIINKAVQERKDANKTNVILSEGVDPAVEKYSIPELPKIYSSKKQLEAQLAFTLCPETNSITGFKEIIRPEIEFAAGQGIEPVGLTKALKAKSKIARRNQARKSLT